jgi:cell division protein FtsL
MHIKYWNFERIKTLKNALKKLSFNAKILLLALLVVLFEISIIIVMCKMKGW